MKDCIEVLYVDGQNYEFKYTRILKKDGSIEYQCELLGSSVSTFNYRKKYIGKELEHAIASLGAELRRAINELMEI